jgi:hypothetical protein
MLLDVITENTARRAPAQNYDASNQETEAKIALTHECISHIGGIMLEPERNHSRKLSATAADGKKRRGYERSRLGQRMG